VTAGTIHGHGNATGFAPPAFISVYTWRRHRAGKDSGVNVSRSAWPTVARSYKELRAAGLTPVAARQIVDGLVCVGAQSSQWSDDARHGRALRSIRGQVAS
jgi:hypothetical protein